MRGAGCVQAMKMAAAFVNSSELAKWVRDLKDEQIELECYCQVCSSGTCQISLLHLCRVFSIAIPRQALHACKSGTCCKKAFRSTYPADVACLRASRSALRSVTLE